MFFSWIIQELEYQKKRPQELGDKFVSVVSQFITVASFSFSDVEDLLTETKELVSHGGCYSVFDSITVTCRHSCWKPASRFLSVQLFLHAFLTSSVTFAGRLTAGAKCFQLPASATLTLYWSGCSLRAGREKPGTEGWMWFHTIMFGSVSTSLTYYFTFIKLLSF